MTCRHRWWWWLSLLFLWWWMIIIVIMMMMIMVHSVLTSSVSLHKTDRESVDIMKAWWLWWWWMIFIRVIMMLMIMNNYHCFRLTEARWHYDIMMIMIWWMIIISVIKMIAIVSSSDWPRDVDTANPGNSAPVLQIRLRGSFLLHSSHTSLHFTNITWDCPLYILPEEFIIPHLKYDI